MGVSIGIRVAAMGIGSRAAPARPAVRPTTISTLAAPWRATFVAAGVRSVGASVLASATNPAARHLGAPGFACRRAIGDGRGDEQGDHDHTGAHMRHFVTSRSISCRRTGLQWCEAVQATRSGASIVFTTRSGSTPQASARAQP